MSDAKDLTARLNAAEAEAERLRCLYDDEVVATREAMEAITTRAERAEAERDRLRDLLQRIVNTCGTDFAPVNEARALLNPQESAKEIKPHRPWDSARLKESDDE